MKKLVLALVIGPLLMLAACGTSETTTPASVSSLPHSVKGYELYSWQQGGQWLFTLTLGTKRVKFADEIIPNPTSEPSDIRGITLDALLNTLARLPSGEWLFWNTLRDASTSYPPQEMIDRVTARAGQLGLQMAVAPL
jgi:hypothetical protein